MKALSQKTVFAILMAAMFCFCIILALETKFQFGWMVGGFALAFVVSFVFLYIRLAPLVIAGSIALILVGYLLFKIGDPEIRQIRGISAAIGAISAIVCVLMLQMGWVKPSQETTGSADYVKQQQAIYQQEKGGNVDYLTQQRALYEQEKAKQAQGGGPSPQGPGSSGQGQPPV